MNVSSMYVFYCLFVIIYLSSTTVHSWIYLDLDKPHVTGLDSNIEVEGINGHPQKSRHLSGIYGHRRMHNCSAQALIKILPQAYAKKTLKLRLEYSAQPKLWTFHMGNHKELMGYGNSGKVNGAQVQIHGSELRFYSSSTNAADYNQSVNALLRRTQSKIIGYKPVNIEFIIKDETLTYSSDQNGLTGKVLVGDLLNLPIYISANRAIATDALYGQGLCKLRVNLSFKSKSELKQKLVKRSSCRTGKLRKTCDPHAACHRKRQRNSCACRPGFKGNGSVCWDINECDSHNGNCVHLCQNSVGSFSCSCLAGFRLLDNNKDCQDEDECSHLNICSPGICVNGVGSYICLQPASLNCTELGCEHTCDISGCLCYPGFALASDYKTCQRQCSKSNGGCHHRCHETSTGGSLCGCRPGYVLDKDMSTCHATCSMDNGGCERTCRQTDRGPLCSCPRGFVLSINRRSCIDIDECESDNGGCQFLCINIRGSYECLCPTGYKLDSDTKTCNDINECNSGYACQEYCNNTLGSYICSCKSGYYLYSRMYCTDINECSNENGGCAELCVNLPGTYKCKCPPGFSLHPNEKDCMPSECSGQRRPSVVLDCYANSCVLMCHRHHMMQTNSQAYTITCNIQSNSCKNRVLTIERQVKDCTSETKMIQAIQGAARGCVEDIELCSFNVNCRAKSDHVFILTVQIFSFDEGMISYQPETRTQCGAHPICYQKSCSTGSYINRTVWKCLNCPPGTYQPSHGSLYCLPCPWPHKESQHVGAESSNQCADLCPPGHYSIDGVRPCGICALGSYQPEYGRTQCVQCGHGLTTALDASTKATDCILPTFCPEGHYFSLETSSCHPCGKGYYQTNQGQRSCIQCPLGLTTDVQGSNKITDCKDTECRRGGSRRQGWLSTPNYPNEYPVNVTCQWRLKPDFDEEAGVKKARRHLIVISRLDLADDKCADYVVIRKSGSPTSATTWEACTSRAIPIAITAQSRKLMIQFHSNALHTSNGFKLHYVTFREEFESLIEDIVSDQYLYTVPSYSSVLQNEAHLSTLADVVADLNNYRRYMLTDQWKTFPKSFMHKFLWPKIHKFFDLPDFEHLDLEET